MGVIPKSWKTITLGQYLFRDVMDVVTKKKRFGMTEFNYSGFIIGSLWVFQKGAVLGHARGDRLETLAELVAVEGQTEETLAYLNSEPGVMLEDYFHARGKEPSSFVDLWMSTRWRRWTTVDIKERNATYKRPVYIDKLLSKCQSYAAIGMGFGALRPDLVAKMWVSSYEMDDSHSWAQHGLELPPQMVVVPLKEMEQLVLRDVAEYVSASCPSLLAPLGLRL